MYKQIFKEHFRKYPLMLPNDFFKLIYQNSHGPHHLDSETLTSNFLNELSSLKTSPKYYFEYIGNNYTRVYLSPNWTVKEKNLILDAFIKSNLDYRPNTKLLYDELMLLQEMVNLNEIAIDHDLFNKSLDNYLSNGIKAISHSTIYKQEYNPHYVVINNLYLEPIKNILEVNNEKRKKASSFQANQRDS